MSDRPIPSKATETLPTLRDTPPAPRPAVPSPPASAKPDVKSAAPDIEPEVPDVKAEKPDKKPAMPGVKFVEVQVQRKCVPTYLRTRNTDSTVYEGDPTPFDEDGNPVRQGGGILTPVPPGTIMQMEAKEATHFMRAGVVLPTYNSMT